jgi:outer membrane protein OmpA-like peptidoglycan-associated protein
MKNKIIIFLVLFMGIQITGSVAQFSKLIVSLTGTIKDEVTGKPVDVEMEVYDDQGKITDKKNLKAANEGKYFLTGLNPGRNYIIRIASTDYLNQEFTMAIPNTNKYAEFSRDFVVKPKVLGAKIKFKVPPFELNKTKLRAGSNFFLKDDIELLRRNRTLKVELACFPDNDNNADNNKKLTEGRCESLRDFFVANGIQPNRIITKSESKTDPENPPPLISGAKGKRYIGSIYFVIKEL